MRLHDTKLEDFFSILRGPCGADVSATRLPGCTLNADAWPTDKGPRRYVFPYELRAPGLAEPVTLYLDYAENEELRAPSGFMLMRADELTGLWEISEHTEVLASCR